MRNSDDRPRKVKRRKDGTYEKGTPSPNPKGRPKKKANLGAFGGSFQQAIIAIAQSKTTIHEGGKAKTVSLFEAGRKKAWAERYAGEEPPMRLALLTLEAEAAEQKKKYDLLEAAIEYKSYWGRIKHDLGPDYKGPPVTLPDPDDIIITDDGEVHCVGPLFYDELRSNSRKPLHPDDQRLLEKLRIFEREVEILITALAAAEDEDTRKFIADDLEGAHLNAKIARAGLRLEPLTDELREQWREWRSKNCVRFKVVK